MKYYLSIDLGQNKENRGRYIQIDLTKYNKKGYFSSLQEATLFTSNYDNYCSLFMDLYNNNLITSDLIGNPFVYSYNFKDETKHCGTNHFVKENKILFKNDINLFKRPTDEELKNAYFKRQQEKYLNEEDKSIIIFNLTNKILEQELNPTNNFNYDNVSYKEKNKYDFIEQFNKMVQFIINSYKRSMLYNTNENYQYIINLMDSYNNDIKKYLYDAKKNHIVDSRYFSKPMSKLIQLLCTKVNYKKETIEVDNSRLFDLITIYKCYFDMINKKMYTDLKELEYLLLSKKNTCIQIDIWGNEVPMETKKTRRKKM